MILNTKIFKLALIIATNLDSKCYKEYLNNFSSNIKINDFDLKKQNDVVVNYIIILNSYLSKINHGLSNLK